MEDVIWQRDFLHDSDEFYADLSLPSSNSNSKNRAIVIDVDDDGDGGGDDANNWKCRGAFNSCMQIFARIGSSRSHVSQKKNEIQNEYEIFLNSE